MNIFNGGKAIDSGGYGCVFLPSLKCKNSINSSQNKSFISKLMVHTDADDEYNLIQQFNKKLKFIPNYSNYFLLDNFEICNPSQLMSDDLINYDSECSNLIEQGITSSNINSKLTKIKTINMPFGGVNIRKFIKNNFNSIDMIKLNNSLINLLQNGIIPMNELNVFHADLKSSNMLANKENDGSISVKIIDWGLSFIRENMNEIPKNVTRPIHFNLPVSIVVFNKLFDSKLSKFISKNPSWTPKSAKIFTAMFLNDYIKTRNKSHLNILIKTIDEFNSLTNIISKKFSKKPTNYILDYIAEIVYKYTQNGKFNKLSYFNQVYLKNIDVWGFLTTYLDFYEQINSKKKLTTNDIAFLGKIKKIFMETLFLNSTTPINIPILINKLMDLNSNFQKMTESSIGGKRSNIGRINNNNNKSIRINNNKKKRKYNKTKKQKQKQ
jgi:hypothetical protein